MRQANSDINQKISSWLKGARRSRGATLNQVSSGTGISPVRISLFEHGSPVPLNVLYKLILHYNLDLEEFISLTLEFHGPNRQPPNRTPLQ